jgi:hypothetical protein
MQLLLNRILNTNPRHHNLSTPKPLSSFQCVNCIEMAIAVSWRVDGLIVPQPLLPSARRHFQPRARRRLPLRLQPSHRRRLQPEPDAGSHRVSNQATDAASNPEPDAASHRFSKQ